MQGKLYEYSGHSPFMLIVDVIYWKNVIQLMTSASLFSWDRLFHNDTFLANLPRKLPLALTTFDIEKEKLWFQSIDDYVVRRTIDFFYWNFSNDAFSRLHGFYID